MTDLAYPPQRKERKRVILRDRHNLLLLKRRVTVWRGEPIGDWTNWQGHRIALRALADNSFEGIVPDNFD